MRIVAVENIPFVEDAFAGLGEVEVVPAAELSPARLAGCELLLVRSTRKIDASVLDGTPVRFVATSTIGFDHVDLGYLERRGIAFASAPGSNATSVADYITAALLVVAQTLGRTLAGLSLGVVGVGNVGGRVVKRAEALGMRVLQCDPPLARRTGEPRFRPIEELLEADVLTFHVPLTSEGADATRHMVDDRFLARLKPGAVLINSSRGAVVDGAALLRAIETKRLAACVLDVWEGEPRIDARLLAAVTLGTPHIAGHSFDGKVNGTKMIYDAACRFLGVEPNWDPAARRGPAPLMPPPAVPRIALDAAGRADEDVLREAVLRVYDIREDDAALRRMPAGDAGARHFSALRKNYRDRREFHDSRVELAGGTPGLRRKLAGIGFEV